MNVRPGGTFLDSMVVWGTAGTEVISRYQRSALKVAIYVYLSLPKTSLQQIWQQDTHRL